MINFYFSDYIFGIKKDMLLNILNKHRFSTWNIRFMNKKDPTFMEMLSKGLSKMNELKIRRPDGAVYEFEIS